MTRLVHVEMQTRLHPTLQSLRDWCLLTPVSTGIGDSRGGAAAGLESNHARVASRGTGGGGRGGQGGVSSPSQSASQAAGFSLTNSAGAGGTDRFSSRGGDRPGTAQAVVFLLRMDVEGEV